MPGDASPVTEEQLQETPHILIVEDQPTTADMLSVYFQSQGYRTDAVASGEDAFAFVAKAIPDLILLDIWLPDVDGYEICRELRAHERTKHVPIIFLTGSRKQTAKLKGLKLGAVDYITKPFDIQELRLRVRNVLGHSYSRHWSHRITGLPMGSLVDEQLGELLGRSDWALLSVSLQGLKQFSEKYGFVAGDDVLRSVALILTHVRDEQAPDAFVGHLDSADFLVISGPDKARNLEHALRMRLNEALSFFYPYADREKADSGLPLSISIERLRPSTQSFEGVEDLKVSLMDLPKNSPTRVE